MEGCQLFLPTTIHQHKLGGEPNQIDQIKNIIIREPHG